MIYRYSKESNNYLQNYDKNAVLLYLMHINANNLYERAMFQKLSVGGFK